MQYTCLLTTTLHPVSSNKAVEFLLTLAAPLSLETASSGLFNRSPPAGDTVLPAPLSRFGEGLLEKLLWLLPRGRPLVFPPRPNRSSDRERLRDLRLPP